MMPATEGCSPSGCKPQHSKDEDATACLTVPIVLWFLIGVFAAPISSLMHLYSVSKLTSASKAKLPSPKNLVLAYVVTHLCRAQCLLSRCFL